MNLQSENVHKTGQVFEQVRDGISSSISGVGEFACGVSGYLLGVNPFNQPGVESYKKNMFALLGKPGYEEAREALMKRL